MFKLIDYEKKNHIFLLIFLCLFLFLFSIKSIEENEFLEASTQLNNKDSYNKCDFSILDFIKSIISFIFRHKTHTNSITWKLYLNSVVLVNKSVSYQDFSEDEKFFCQACTFKDIKNTMSNAQGGAFCYNNTEGKVSVSQTTILRCYSKSSAGAFYIFTKSYMFRYNCISQCYAGKSIMGFTVIGDSTVTLAETPNVLHEINELSHIDIGPPKFDSEYSLTLFSSTCVYMKNSNFSKSRRIFNDCTIAAEFMNSVKFEFINFIDNKGPGVISFFHSFPETILKSSNFVRNDANKCPIFDLTNEKKIAIEDCVFIKNMFGRLVICKEGTNLVFSRCYFDLSRRTIDKDNSGFVFDNCSFLVEAATVSITMKTNEQCLHATEAPSPTTIMANIGDKQFYHLESMYPVSLMIMHRFILVVLIISIGLSIYIHKIGSKISPRIMRKYIE